MQQSLRYLFRVTLIIYAVLIATSSAMASEAPQPTGSSALQSIRQEPTLDYELVEPTVLKRTKLENKDPTLLPPPTLIQNRNRGRAAQIAGVSLIVIATPFGVLGAMAGALAFGAEGLASIFLLAGASLLGLTCGAILAIGIPMKIAGSLSVTRAKRKLIEQGYSPSMRKHEALRLQIQPDISVKKQGVRLSMRF